jgi:membrane protein DedA with SNARE-associated domain
VLASIIDVAANVGLPVLFLLIAVETTGIPVPGETALLAAAILASKGKLSIEAVIAVAAVAAVVGDNFGFLLGRRLGRKVLRAPGPLYNHRIKVLEVGEPFFDEHGPKAVFLGRWITGLRITSAWLAGANRMSWPTFLFYNAAGGVAWAASVGLAGYYLGDAGESAIRVIGLGGLVVVTLAVIVFLLVRRSRQRREVAQVDGEPAAAGADGDPAAARTADGEPAAAGAAGRDTPAA